MSFLNETLDATIIAPRYMSYLDNIFDKKTEASTSKPITCLVLTGVLTRKWRIPLKTLKTT
jgi:hypothetical protein